MSSTAIRSASAASPFTTRTDVLGCLEFVIVANLERSRARDPTRMTARRTAAVGSPPESPRGPCLPVPLLLWFVPILLPFSPDFKYGRSDANRSYLPGFQSRTDCEWCDFVTRRSNPHL